MTTSRYNFWGWYAGPAEPGDTRAAPIAPGNLSQSEEVGALRANWTGYAWVDLPFSLPPEIPPEQPPVPAKVTRRQARQALFLSGISLATVDALIDALPEPARTVSRIFWEDSNDFERANATLNTMAAALNLTQAQLDDLFRLAQTL